MQNLHVQKLAFPLVSLALLGGSAHAQMGHTMTGVGAVNQSMAGVSTGLPIDASGALHWNPAAITGIECCELQFSMEMFESTLNIDSVADFGGGAFNGSTDSDMCTSAIPTFAFTHKLQDTDWTVGLGAVGVAGFGVDFPSDPSNPVFAAFGQVSSNFQMLQIQPTAALQINDHWSVGFSPTISQGRLAVNPASFASPDDANGDMTPSYPSALSGGESWAFGGQLGVFYQGESGWTFGASYKSNLNFDKYKFNATDELGMPRMVEFDMDFPAIASVGMGYSGFDRWSIGLDLRHIDYSNTNGFAKSGFDATGAVQGFGWDSIGVAALAAQFEATDRLTLRAGFAVNDSPIDSDTAGFNIAAPAIITEHLGLGATWKVSDHMKFDFAYTHGLENTVSGPMQTPAGPMPGSNVDEVMSTDSFLIGLRMAF